MTVSVMENREIFPIVTTGSREHGLGCMCLAGLQDSQAGDKVGLQKHRSALDRALSSSRLIFAISLGESASVTVSPPSQARRGMEADWQLRWGQFASELEHVGAIMQSLPA